MARSALLRISVAAVTLLLLAPVAAQTSPARSVPLVDGQPLTVSVGAYLIDLISVNDVQETFSADLVIGVVWRDPRLADPTASGTRRVGIDDAWYPEIEFMNGREITSGLEQYLLVEPDGTARYNQRYTGTFSVELDLARFPFDQQSLGIEMVVARTRPSDVRLEVNRELVGREAKIRIAGWQLDGFRAEAGVKSIGLAGYEFPAAHIQVLVHRERAYYIWKVIFPLILIVMMSSTVFWIPPRLVPPQVGISTASVLTLIAFYLTIGTQLPRISYLTHIDLFVLGCTSLVFLAFGESVVTGSLVTQDKIDEARKLDRWARRVFLVLFSLLLVFTFMT